MDFTDFACFGHGLDRFLLKILLIIENPFKIPLRILTKGPVIENPRKSRIFRFAGATFWSATFSKINIFWYPLFFFESYDWVEHLKALSRCKTPPDAKVTTHFVRAIFENFRFYAFWGLGPPQTCQYTGTTISCNQCYFFSPYKQTSRCREHEV